MLNNSCCCSVKTILVFVAGCPLCSATFHDTSCCASYHASPVAELFCSTCVDAQVNPPRNVRLFQN